MSAPPTRPPTDVPEEPLTGDPLEDSDPGVSEFEDDDFESPSGDFSVLDEQRETIELAADLPVEDPDELDPSTFPLAATPPPEQDTQASVRTVVGVRFSPAGRLYPYDGGDGRFRQGERVVVESDRGPRLGTVAVASKRLPMARSSTKKILRRPTSTDLLHANKNTDRERDVVIRAKALAKEVGLTVKVYRAEYNLAGSRVTVYFSADGKIDTRPLASALGKEVRGRVDLRQTGVRDEAKLIGGIGSCGQTLCCSTWLPSFVPVSIRNAKDQGLVLNPAKVSGQCGRLKCCLVYEHALYAELRKGMPKLGKRVVTNDGDEGRVVEVDVLKQRIRVALPGGEFRVYDAKDVTQRFPSKQ